MNIKTLNVFYGGDFLPYKDKERQVHYPNVGSDFQGAENITSIRFYIDEISSNNTTFAVAIELPNGKIGSKVLEPAQYDSEIGEYYVTLDIDRFITQKVGNVSISLRGYQGDIELEYDDDSQLYVLVGGTPITAVTGSIKLRVNQEPQALQGELDEEVTLQELLGLVATKLNVGDGIVILGDISMANLSDYEVGQIFYDRDTHTYYEKTDTSPYYTKALSGVGVLGAPNIVCKNDDETRTIRQLNIIYSDMRIFSSSYLGKDFLCCTKSQGSNLYTFVAFDIENQVFYKKASVSGDTLPSSVLVPANKIEIASKAFLTSNYVPYSGANSNVHLNGHYLYGAKVYTDHNGENHDSFKALLEEENIPNVGFVLKQNTEIYDDKIDEVMYEYFLSENATLTCRGLNYRKLKETETDIIYACLNGSISPITDGTSIVLGRVVTISKTSSIDGVHTYTESDLTIDLYSKDQAKTKFGTSLALELNNTNYKLVAKLYNANGGLIDTSNEVDLPLESIVSSATYYDTYTYEGVTYTKVIVITLSTTSVPTIVPVGDLISGLEKEACVEISSSSGTLTEGQMQTLALDNASIKFNGRIYHKVTNSFFNSVEVVANQEQGQWFNFVLSYAILVTPSTREYQYVEKFIQVYNKDEIDTIVQGLQYGIDTNAHDIDTLEGDITDIQGDIDDIDERLDNHDTEMAKMKKDIDYAMKYPLVYGTPTTDTDEDIGLTTEQLPATTLPKGLINYVGGSSFAVNQQFSNSDFSDGTNGWETINNSTLAVTDGIARVTATENNDIALKHLDTPATIANNKYFVSAKVRTSSPSVSVLLSTVFVGAEPHTNSQDFTYLDMISYSNSSYPVGTAYPQLLVQNAGIGDWFEVQEFFRIDLTQMFGAGNEPTTTSDPRIQWLIHYLTNNPQYNEGSIVNAPVEKLSSKGFNIWDEEWENGVYSYFDGGKSANPNYLRNKNPISAFPNTDYYFKNSGSDYMVLFYTKDNDYIGYVSSNSFKTPSNCRYVCFYVNNSTYNHDICINLSGTMNGTYLPYQAPSEYPIPAEVQALDGYGLGIDDTTYNYIDFERKKFVKKVGVVDLGSLEWIYNNNYNYWQTNISGMKDEAKSVCSNFTKSSWISVTQTSGTYYIDTSSQIYMNNGSTTTRPTGTLYFELATPIETDISEYLDRDFPNENLIDTYQGGEVEFENDNDMGVPYSLTYQYKVE